jgi:hypothetical protein
MRIGILGSGLMGGKLGRLFARSGGEVAIEPFLRPLRSAGIDLTRIEPPALLLVLEQIIGSRYVLELRLRLLVARMQIGMEFACQFLECVLDLLVGRGHLTDPVFIPTPLESMTMSLTKLK